MSEFKIDPFELPTGECLRCGKKLEEEVKCPPDCKDEKEKEFVDTHTITNE